MGPYYRHWGHGYISSGSRNGYQFQDYQFLKLITSIYRQETRVDVEAILAFCSLLSTVLERWGTTCPTSQDGIVKNGVFTMRLSCVLNKIICIRFVTEHIGEPM